MLFTQIRQYGLYLQYMAGDSLSNQRDKFQSSSQVQRQLNQRYQMLLLKEKDLENKLLNQWQAFRQDFREFESLSAQPYEQSFVKSVPLSGQLAYRRCYICSCLSSLSIMSGQLSNQPFRPTISGISPVKLKDEDYQRYSDFLNCERSQKISEDSSNHEQMQDLLTLFRFTNDIKQTSEISFSQFHNEEMQVYYKRIEQCLAKLQNRIYLLQSQNNRLKINNIQLEKTKIQIQKELYLLKRLINQCQLLAQLNQPFSFSDRFVSYQLQVSSDQPRRLSTQINLEQTFILNIQAETVAQLRRSMISNEI